jgi:glutathione reductase (NADPH)
MSVSLFPSRDNADSGSTRCADSEGREHAFDVVIVSGAPEAIAAAAECLAAGQRVAAVVDPQTPLSSITENRELMMLLARVADLADFVRRTSASGLFRGSATPDWDALMAFAGKNQHLFAEEEQALRRLGIPVYSGSPRFISPGTLTAGDNVLRASNFVIATGTAPARLGIPGEELLASDWQLFEGKKPKRVIFVGDGPAAFELAHFCNRSDVEAIILCQSKTPLAGFDADLVDMLAAHTRRVGVTVRCNAQIEEIDYGTVRTAEGSLRADYVIHAGERRPLLEGLNLGAIGVTATAAGIEVNEHLQSTTNAAVYAAGAAAGATWGSAAARGRLAASNLLRRSQERSDFCGAARYVATLPPLAMTGLTEEQARHAGLEFEIRTGSLARSRNAGLFAQECSGFKVLVERGAGRILGAHLLGEGAEETINLFAVAIRHNLTLDQVAAPSYASPTRSPQIGSLL